MQMNMKRMKSIGAAGVAAAILSAGSTVFAQVSQTVYQNTTTKTGQQYAPATGTQFGNEDVITAPNPLEPSGNVQWGITGLSFEYNSGAAVSGSPVGSGVLNIYANTGANAAGPNSASPGATALYTSPSFNLTGSGTSGALVTFSGLNVIVPTTFTWTVTFTTSGGSTLGLDTYGPPTVGNAFNDIWQKTGTGWELLAPNGSVQANGTPATFAVFGSSFSAYPVPEPGTIAMGFMGLLATGGLMLRRKNA
jgi:hypothetical protein